MYRTQKWVHAQSPEALAELIAGYFPTLDRGVLVGALGRYKAQGVWGDRADLVRGRLCPVARRVARQRLSRPLGAVRRVRRQPAGGGCDTVRLSGACSISFMRSKDLARMLREVLAEPMPTA